MGNVAKMEIEITVDDKGTVKIENIGKAADKAGEQAKKGFGKGSTAAKSFNGIMGEIKQSVEALGPAIVGYLGVKAVGGVISLADSMSALNGKITLVTDSSAEMETVQELLYAQSQETGTALQGNIKSYTGLAMGLADVGVKSSEVLAINEAVTKSLIVSGATTDQTNSFQLQFTQAMQSGVVAGDEFRAMMESNSVFAQQLAAALDTDIAGLREMSKAGTLTADVVRKAIPQMSDAINVAFDEIPLTISRALVQVENAFTKIVSDGNEAAEGTTKIAESISELAQSAEDNAPAIQAIFSTVILGAEIAVKGVSFLVGTFQSVAAVANTTSGVIFQITGAIGEMTDAVGLTDNATSMWKINADAAYASANDLAHQANDSFQQMLGNSKKAIGGEEEYRKALEKNLKEIEKNEDAQEDRSDTTVEGLKKIAEEERVLAEEVLKEAAKVAAEQQKVQEKRVEENQKALTKILEEEKRAAEERKGIISTMWKEAGLGGTEYYQNEAARLTEQAEAWTAAGADRAAVEQHLYDELSTLSAEAWSKQAVDAGVFLDDLRGDWTSATDDITSGIDKINNKEINVEADIDIDIDRAEEGIAEVESSLNQLESEDTLISIDADISGFSSSMESMTGSLAVNTQSVAELRAAIATLDATPTLDPFGDTRQKYQSLISDLAMDEKAAANKSAALRIKVEEDLISDKLKIAEAGLEEAKDAEIAAAKEIAAQKIEIAKEAAENKISEIEGALASEDTILSAFRQMASDQGIVDIDYFKAEADALTRQAQEWQDAGVSAVKIEQWLNGELGDLRDEAAEKGVAGFNSYSDALSGSYSQTGVFSEKTVQAQDEIAALQAEIDSLQNSGLDGFMDGGTSSLSSFSSAVATAEREIASLKNQMESLNSSSSSKSSSSSSSSSAVDHSTYYDMFAFDGGGYTGNDPRSGGLDGKGGFLAMLHPQETVIDHTKPSQSKPSVGQASSKTTVNNNTNNVSVYVQQKMARSEIEELIEKQKIQQARS